MSEPQTPVGLARRDLLPLVEQLCALTREEGSADQEAFFGLVRAGLEGARDPDDLAGPFMELSTSAFRGFRFSPAVGLLLDRVLAAAQTLSATLSAADAEPH